jgi:hypothetical protein
MLFGETVAVYCENHTEHTDKLCVQNVGFFLLSKQMVHILTTVRLMDIVMGTGVRGGERASIYRIWIFEGAGKWKFKKNGNIRNINTKRGHAVA